MAQHEPDEAAPRPAEREQHDSKPPGAAPGADDATDATQQRPAGADVGRFGIPGRPLRRNSFLVGFTGALGVLLAYAVYLGVRNAAGILVLVVIALFLAVGLHPAVVRLRSWGFPRGLAVATVVLIVLALLAAGVLALVPPIVTQSGQFVEQLPSYLESLRRNETVNDLVEQFDLMRRAQEATSADMVGRALGGVLGGAQLVFGTVFRVLTVLVLTIYFLVYFDRLRNLAYALVPRSRRQRVQLIGDEVLTKVGAYMVGALAIAVLAGASTFVFALIVGLPYPFALAVVVAVTDLIPQIGATLGAVIVSLVGFATDPSVGIACVIFFVVYQQVENYLIYPKIMRRSVQVNEVAALVAALLGVSLVGVIGALIAIPTVAAIQLILREVVLPRQDAR
ncbi:AI-2E family transporter [Verrucosispora sp. WMMA2044]|uniref:AI-2E family transporter n=1 Tax=Verrucosispora sioxanthis TaxID=2499994 RepID=A0A6M1KZT0_9ACTN|nr:MULTISPECIES: AI-2E family transporter [Micromonospora]NEE64579.1 AI-2E family transporter [Verrucosispora sioxanthis]NGM13689.1 AI-2E family transporter [Verrucosispora sioxanthis]WBB49396.1 AI-2E family transporter [Verrucosispora sp. WMMA2044]